jgi:hypothetical protein
VIDTYKYLKEEILFDQLLAFFELELGLVKIKLSGERKEKRKVRERRGEERRGEVVRAG